MRPHLRLIIGQRRTHIPLLTRHEGEVGAPPDRQRPGQRRDWYRAQLELDLPESAVHATEILGHHADIHAAVVRHQPGQPVIIVALQADSISHACRSAIDLVRATGHRPISIQVTAWPVFGRSES